MNPLEEHLAPYAIRSEFCGGRVHAEPDDPLRNPFAVDRRRIVGCTAFRRLEHKTQVFTAAHHDHFRTRLTHTLEVAQLARLLARHLRANEELAEAIALAHDLGHPPFGHAGEGELNAILADHGGFNHNTHSRRVVEYLEHPFPAFRGLNLTAATRIGLSTHVTRYDIPWVADDPVSGGEFAKDQEGSCTRRDGEDGGPRNPSVEAQIASVADRIAYNCHDLEDAIGAGFLDWESLVAVELWREACTRLNLTPGGCSIHSVRRAVLDALIDALLQDVIEASRTALAPMRSPQAVQDHAGTLVAWSSTREEQLRRLEDVLREEVYRRAEVGAMDVRGREMVRTLFDAFRSEPGVLPRRFAERIPSQALDRVICDYIAGMTDRFCAAEVDRVLRRDRRADPTIPRGMQAEGS